METPINPGREFKSTFKDYAGFLVVDHLVEEANVILRRWKLRLNAQLTLTAEYRKPKGVRGVKTHYRVIVVITALSHLFLPRTINFISLDESSEDTMA